MADNPSSELTVDLKKWEEFYKYARANYDLAHTRWVAADDKIWKYLSILGLVLGAGAVAIGQVARVYVKTAGWSDWLFLGAYATTILSAIASFYCYLTALELKASTAPPSQPEVVSYFNGNDYLTFLKGMGEKLLEAANSAQESVEDKLRTAKWGFRFMKLTGIALIVASVAYFLVQTRWSTVEDPKPPTINIVNEGGKANDERATGVTPTPDTANVSARTPPRHPAKRNEQE